MPDPRDHARPWAHGPSPDQRRLFYRVEAAVALVVGLSCLALGMVVPGLGFLLIAALFALVPAVRPALAPAPVRRPPPRRP